MSTVIIKNIQNETYSTLRGDWRAGSVPEIQRFRRILHHYGRNTQCLLYGSAHSTEEYLEAEMLDISETQMGFVFSVDAGERLIYADSEITVLSPKSIWEDVRKIGGKSNYVLFNRHTVWTERGISFTAVKAEHSDSCAIGVIIDNGEKKNYVTVIRGEQNGLPAIIIVAQNFLR